MYRGHVALEVVNPFWKERKREANCELSIASRSFQEALTNKIDFASVWPATA